jgi:hypothetical protein
MMPIVSTRSSQFSDWINIAAQLPGFEFLFQKPTNTLHWMFCLRVQSGQKKSDIGALVATG